MIWTGEDGTGGSTLSDMGLRFGFWLGRAGMVKEDLVAVGGGLDRSKDSLVDVRGSFGMLNDLLNAGADGGGWRRKSAEG